jgi:hypothetical protein
MSGVGIAIAATLFSLKLGGQLLLHLQKAGLHVGNICEEGGGGLVHGYQVG